MVVVICPKKYFKYDFFITGPQCFDVNITSNDVCIIPIINDFPSMSAELSFGFKMVDVWYKTDLHLTVKEDIATFETFRDLEKDIKDINASNREEWKHKHCQRSCMSTVKQWGGLFPVTDNDTLTIYVNRVCAICHDVISITPWAMSIFCSEDMEDMYYLDILSGVVSNVNLTKHCKLLFKPPFENEYHLALLFEENNFLCPLVSVMEGCMYNNNFKIPVGVTHTKYEIQKQCEEKSDNYRVPHKYKHLFIDPMCLICNRLYRSHMTLTSEIPKNTRLKSFGFRRLLQWNVQLEVVEGEEHIDTKSVSKVCDEHSKVNLCCVRWQSCQARNM